MYIYVCASMVVVISVILLCASVLALYSAKSNLLFTNLCEGLSGHVEHIICVYV